MMFFISRSVSKERQLLVLLGMVEVPKELNLKMALVVEQQTFEPRSDLTPHNYLHGEQLGMMTTD